MATQLTMEERETVSRMLATGRSPIQIASELGRRKSTIYRELARNTTAAG